MQQQVNGLGANLETQGAPGKCPAHFESRPKQKEPNSPVCTNVPYITIFVPGGEIVERPASEKDKANYPREWAAYEAGNEAQIIGWPIDKAPFLDVAQAATYRLMGIPTMEALAVAPDNVIQTVMGGLAHRDKAKAMIKATTDAGPMLDLAQKNEELALKVDLQAKQIAELCEEMEKMKKGKDKPKAEAKTE